MPGKKKAICSVCQKVLAYSDGTLNLHEYLSSKHSLQYFSAGSEMTTTGSKRKMLDEFVKPSNCTKACAKGIADQVSQMIVQNL